MREVHTIRHQIDRPPRAFRAAALLLATIIVAPPLPPEAGAAAPRQGGTPRTLAPGTHKVVTDQRVGGFRRSYLVHVPAGHDGVTPLPVVLALHGAFSTARALERYSGLSRLADREGFLVVYPNGIGLFDLLRHWNSGHCCGKARKMNLDDVGFALGAVEEVARTLPVDRGRLYVVGHSNGGMMAYRIAAERPDLVAALATVAATIGGSPSAGEPEWMIPRPARPVPVLTLHGRADQNVPYEGGRGEKSRGRSGTISVARSIGLWVDANGCDPGPALARSHGGRVERQTWSGCVADSGVELYSLDAWGHDWPGGPYTARLEADDPLRGFEAAEIIWQFFQRHRRTP